MGTGSPLPLRRAIVTALSATLLMVPIQATPRAFGSSHDFDVTSLGDQHDANPGNGTCATALATCTVRAAVEEANALGGTREIMVPAGTYSITANIAVTGDVTITGAGAAFTIFQPGSGTSAQAIFLLAAGASLAVQGAAFTDPTSEGVAFTQLDGDDASVRLEDVAVTNANWTAAFVANGVDRAVVEVVRATITDVWYPIFFDEGLDQILDIRDSLISAGRYSGIFVDTRTGTFRISDSEIVDRLGHGIEFYTSTQPGDGTSTLEVIRTRITNSDGQGLYVAPARIPGVTTHTTRVIDSVIADNASIGAWVEGNLVIDDSTISGNGVDEFSAAVDQSRGSVAVSSSTISGNGHGLTLFGRGDADPAATVTITNTTISDNASTEWVGIEVRPYAAATITNTTITGSSYGLSARMPISMTNTLIDGVDFDCDGVPALVGGHNADTDGTCGLDDPGDQSGIDPMLGPLVDNGGGTLTRMPLSGSPLIDAGDDGTCAATDQRGLLRPVDGNGDTIATCDIGAVEAGAGGGPGEVDVRWSAPTARRGLLAADGSLTVTLLGAPGGTATARVDVVSWFPDADPSAPMLADATATRVELGLLEISPGEYSGDLPLEGIERVTGLEADLEIGGSTVIDATTERLPAFVAGALVVDVLLDLEPWTLPTPRLLVAGASVADGDALSAPHDGIVTTRWLQPGAYSITVIDAENRTVADVPGSYDVRGGLVGPANVHVAPQPFIPFTAKLVDVNGHPVPGLRVTLVDEATGAQIVKRTTQSDGTVRGLARSPRIGVAVDPLDLPYAAADLDLTLTEFAQVLPVVVGATLPTAVVSGRVLHPNRPPVEGARVSIISEVDGRPFRTSTVAGEGGLYSAVVFQGSVTVFVDEPRAGSASRTVEVLADTEIDLLLDGPALGTIGFELFTQAAGELAPTPVTSPIEFIHLRAFAYDDVTGRRYPLWGSMTDVPVRIPQTFEVCADGVEGGLSKECTTVHVDPATLHAQASLTLRQAGRIEGTLRPLALQFTDQMEYLPLIDARLTRLEGDARINQPIALPQLAEPPVSLEPLNVPFSIGVGEPGMYELQLRISHMLKPGTTCIGPTCVPPVLNWRGTDTVTLNLEVANGAVIVLGDVPMQRCDLAHCVWAFGAGPKTGTSLSPTEIRPGDVVRLRIAAHNQALGETLPVEQARIRAELPDGATVMPDSVTLDGAPAPYTVSGGILEVEVGNIAPFAAPVVQAWLATDPGTTAESMFVEGLIVHGADERVESLGSSTASYRRLTMFADDYATTLEVPVSGRGFAGYDVEVLADGAVVATATAAAGGYWSASAVLPEVPQPKSFMLQARTVVEGVKIVSAPIRVQYDPSLPQLELVLMHQRDQGGAIVRIDPRKAVREFPFVWVPSAPIVVELEFDHPERVRDPWVVLGENRGRATFDEAAGKWVARIWKIADNDWGKLLVAWNYTAATIDLSPDVQPDPMTEAEARALLAPHLNTFANFSSSSSGPGTVSTSVTLPDLDGATLTVDATVTEELYTPTQADLDAAAAIGADIWDYSFEAIPGPDDSGEFRVSFTVPVSSLSASGAVSAAWRGGFAASSGPSAAVDQRTVHLLLVGRLSTRWTVFTTFIDAFSATGEGSLQDATLERLLGLLERVDRGCDPLFAASIVPKLERLRTMYLAMLIGNTALSIASMAAAPATFGAATILLNVATFIAGKAGDYWLQSEIDLVEDEIKRACEATLPPVPPLDLPDDCDRDVWFDACDVLADPTIIVDPSGFTYEVFPEERLAGVTATLETAPTQDGPWSIWDADWFLQENPVLTDLEGRYAWDVPEGWWRVRFELDGYATAYSSALEVLPPHFDVNVGLERLAPPAVADAAGFTGETAVDLRFETWMAATGIGPAAVTVVDGTGEPVPVAQSLPDERTSPDHGQVARTLRLDLGRPLVDGEELTVTIDRSAGTYAGIVGSTDLVVVIVVAPRPILAAPTIATSPGSPSRETWIALHGDAEPGATVRVYLDGACATVPVATLEADADGTYVTPILVLPNASTVVSARQDLGFVTSPCSAPTTYVTDNVSPDAPQLTGTNPASPSSVVDPVVTGGGTEAGASIALYVGGTCTGIPVATGVASGAGTFGIVISVPPDSTTEIRAIATDAAGNPSACSDPITYVHVTSDTPTCVGTSGVELALELVDGPLAVQAGSAHTWLVDLVAIACEDVTDARARGGTPAWATTTTTTENGDVELRRNRKNTVLTWMIGAMDRGDVATLRLEVRGEVGPRAVCGSTLTIVSEWSAAATVTGLAAPLVSAPVGPLQVTVSCVPASVIEG